MAFQPHNPAPMGDAARADVVTHWRVPLPNSLPALGYAVAYGITPDLSAHGVLAESVDDALHALQQVVQVYRIGHGLDLAPEAEAALHVVRHLLDRLGRLRVAYGEWRSFDAPAYFDMTEEQGALLLEINERASRVHIVVHVDLLLPSVQEAVNFWAQMDAFPAAHGHATPEDLERYAQQTRPEFMRLWERAVAVINTARVLLSGDADYLAANGATEERWRWLQEESRAGREAYVPAPMPIAQIPTLALTMDFPLPAWRQAGRTRRLQRNRSHRNRLGHNRGRRK